MADTDPHPNARTADVATEPGATAKVPSIFTVPHMKGFTAAEFMSSVGSVMAVLGIAYLSYDASKSVVHTVIVSAAYSLPTALFGLFAGRVSARNSRRRILLICYSIKPVLYLVMAALAFTNQLSVGLLLVFSALAGTVSAFVSPAWLEFERDAIPNDRLDEANATFGSASAAAGITGSVLGGAAMGAIGVWSVFLFDALSFIGLLWVLAVAHPDEPVHDSRTRVRMRDVVTYVRGKPLLRLAFVRLALLSLLVAPVSQLLPAVAAEVNNSQATLGLLTAAFGVGAVSVALVLNRLKRRYSRTAIINGSFLVTGGILLAFGLLGDPLDAPPLWFVIVASLVPLGLLLTLAQSVLSAIVQVRVDPDMEGPVFASYAIVYTVVAPVGGILLGVFADNRGVWAALILAGLVMTVISVAVAASIRRGHPAHDPNEADDVDHEHLHLMRPDQMLRSHLPRVQAHHARSHAGPAAHGSDAHGIGEPR